MMIVKIVKFTAHAFLSRLDENWFN